MAWPSASRWLLRCAGFLGLVLLAHGAARWAGLVYWQPFINNQAMKIHLLQRDGLDPDLLFLGTSKVNRGVIPAVVEQELSGEGAGAVSAFCLGQRGMSLHAQRIVLGDVLESGCRPRVVALEVSPITLNANHGGFADVLRFYASPWELLRSMPRLSRASHWQAAGRGLFRGMTSIYLYGWSLLLHDGQQGQLARLERLKGGRYETSPEQPVQRLSGMTVQERRQLLQSMRDRGRLAYMREYTIGGEPARGLQEIIRMTRDLDIGLVLFNPPVTGDYHRELYGTGNYRMFLTHLGETTCREGLQFIDCHDGRLGLEDDDFHDFGHLNADGAGTLSRYLAREVLGPLLAGTGLMGQDARGPSDSTHPPAGQGLSGM